MVDEQDVSTCKICLFHRKGTHTEQKKLSKVMLVLSFGASSDFSKKKKNMQFQNRNSEQIYHIAEGNKKILYFTQLKGDHLRGYLLCAHTLEYDLITF